jgi:hypothetical protein
LDECEALTGNRDRWLRDAHGNIFPRLDEPPEPEQEPPRADLDELRAQAAAWAIKEKTKPDSPVAIARATASPSDPEERVTGAPPKPTVAEFERSNPRAYQSPNADLKPPQRKSWAAPPIEGTSYGNAEPPIEGRMSAVPTVRYNRADSPTFHHGPLAVRGPDGKPLRG